MENKIIGIDCDECLVDLINPLNIYYNKRFNASHSFDDYKTYDLEKTWGGTKKRAIGIVDDFYNSSFFEKIQPVSGAKDAIDFLSKKNKLIIITSRPNFMGEKTRKFFEEYFFENFDKIIFTGMYGLETSRQFKGDICVSEGVEFMVEDNLATALDCAKQGINTFLMNRPWNQDYFGNIINLERIKSWYDFLKKVK